MIDEARAQDWHWSSYRATVSQEEPRSFLTTDWILAHFGDDRNATTARYRNFVQAGRDVKVGTNFAVAA